jgi:DME family drug/metabolite transporter
VRQGLLLIALAAVSWGTTGSVTAVLVARADAHPLLIGAARLAVAAVLLLLGARLITGRLAIARADLPRCLAMAACMAAYQATYFTAVTMTGIALAALIAICSAPVIIAALAVGLLGERLTGRIALALVLGVLGTALLIAYPVVPAGPAPRFLAGALLALGAGVAYPLYVVTAKLSLARTAPLPLTAATFTAAALFALPLLAWTDAPVAQAARGWPWLLYLGAVATAGAFALYSVGLRRVPASVAGVVTLLEPLTATLLGMFLFGERLGGAGITGVALLLTAIVLLLGDRTGRSRHLAPPCARSGSVALTLCGPGHGSDARRRG